MVDIAYPFDGSPWIIADTHFFHINIGLYCDRSEGWQDLIIMNWDRFIQPDDIVFHLVDLALGKKVNQPGSLRPVSMKKTLDRLVKICVDWRIVF